MLYVAVNYISGHYVIYGIQVFASWQYVISLVIMLYLGLGCELISSNINTICLRGY